MSLLSGLVEDSAKIVSNLNRALELQNVIKEGFLVMSEFVDKLKTDLAEVKETVAGIDSDVSELDGDVQEVLDKLNAIGDTPTPAEMAEVNELVSGIKTQTSELRARTRAAADKVPEPTA